MLVTYNGFGMQSEDLLLQLEIYKVRWKYMKVMQHAVKTKGNCFELLRKLNEIQQVHNTF